MKIRLFVDVRLGADAEFELSDKQAHYLFNVMKLKSGDHIFCFDNASGEYECRISNISKKSCIVQALKKTKEFEKSPDLTLLFAPVKKDNTDFIIEKATELGVREIVPVITRRTISEKVKTERFRFQVIEAAEQCRRTDIPDVKEPIALSRLLDEWDKARTLFFMDESLNGEDIQDIFAKEIGKPAAILVGPEGGFSDEEFELLRKQPFAKGVTMGRRIMRAETAVVAALSCWQAIAGDWRRDKK